MLTPYLSLKGRKGLPFTRNLPKMASLFTTTKTTSPCQCPSHLHSSLNSNVTRLPNKSMVRTPFYDRPLERRLHNKLLRLTRRLNFILSRSKHLN